MSVEVGLVAALDLGRRSTTLLAVAVSDEKGQAVSPDLPGVLGEAMRAARTDMSGRIGHVVVANTGLAQGPERVAFIGVGGQGEWDAEAVRRFAGRAVRAAESVSWPHFPST